MSTTLPPVVLGLHLQSTSIPDVELDNLRHVSQVRVGCVIAKRLGVALYPPVLRMLNRSSLDVVAFPAFLLSLHALITLHVEFIAQGGKATATTSAYVPLAQQHQLPLRVVPLCAFLHQRPIPLRIRTRFNCPMALTSLSRWPSPPRSWICLSAPRSRIIHRGSCAEPQTSSSFPRAPVVSGLANPCLIPARWCADARAEPLRALCALAFCVRAEAAFGAGYTSRSHPTLSLRLRQGVLTVERAQVAVGARRDPFMSMKQLRPLPPCTCTSRAPVDGVLGTGTGTGTAGPDLMRKEKRAPGNGNADEDGLGARRWRRSAVSLRFGAAAHAAEAVTYCPPALIPPSFVFALALALVPAFACILAPTLSLVSVMPASTWCGVGRAAVVLRVRAHPLPHRPPPHHPSRAHLSSLDAYGYARAVELDRGAGSGVHVYASTFVVALARILM
ncbi:hypothetical protein B0H13DRAFT_2453583 [Mycena leptocephala]|nr:hypothetical protein B0H13DRAFT_2453583 [Mycena leptocephala]